MSGLSGSASKEGGVAANPRLRDWIEQYGPALRRHFQKRGAGADSEDLAQEVFIRLQMASARGAIDNVEGYIFKIANNVMSNRLRHDAVARRHLRDAATDEAEETISPERILLSRESWARLAVAIEVLPPRAREAFYLHRFEEVPYATIARQMGITISAVEKLIGRALKQLMIEVSGGA